jgi:hypothetical protein
MWMSACRSGNIAFGLNLGNGCVSCMHVDVSVLARRYELSLVKYDTTAQHEKRECGGVIDTIEAENRFAHSECEGEGGA